jgi:hypothetical protein
MRLTFLSSRWADPYFREYTTRMSFFGGGQQQQQQQGPDPVFAAKTEMEMYTGALLP